MNNSQLLLFIAGMLLAGIAFVTTVLTMVIRNSVNRAKSEMQIFIHHMMSHQRLENRANRTGPPINPANQNEEKLK
jgi:UPF0716 family protein affecting phage T7 exclusion